MQKFEKENGKIKLEKWRMELPMKSFRKGSMITFPCKYKVSRKKNSEREMKDRKKSPERNRQWKIIGERSTIIFHHLRGFEKKKKTEKQKNKGTIDMVDERICQNKVTNDRVQSERSE